MPDLAFIILIIRKAILQAKILFHFPCVTDTYIVNNLSFVQDFIAIRLIEERYKLNALR